MVSSGVWAHDIPLSHAHDLEEVGNATPKATMKSALEEIGYLGSIPASHKANPIAAHFELHIEQGPHLESTKSKIGIVKGVQAYKWFTVTVKGADCHTGTTPFANRADALLTSAKMIVASHRIAKKHSALASTGILNLEPGSTNTVPGLVRFSLDIRAPLDETVEDMEKEIRAAFDAIASGEDIDALDVAGKPCTVDIKTDSISPAVKFHNDCINCVSDAATGLFEAETTSLTKEMTSGAGHDSVYTSKICPTSMVFIPCRDGVSHNPSEFSTPEDCAIGATVLMGAVLRYDALRTKKGE
jgi:hydantoinase/carbamoylase family amidase